MAWKAILGRTIGTSHRTSNSPCQDWGSLKLIREHDAIFGAVADGAGSAPRSDEGSKLAVDAIFWFLANYKNELFAIDDQASAEDFFKEAARYTQGVIKNASLGEKCSQRDFDCTLLVFVLTPNKFIAMQIGDGLIIVREKLKKNYIAVFSPDKGDYCNATSFITLPNVTDNLQVSIKHEPIDFVFLSSDGVERLAAIDGAEMWIPHPQFLEPLERHLDSAENLREAEEELIKFLDSPKVNSQTSDDKTILLCSYSLSKEWLNVIEKMVDERYEREERIASSRSKSQSLGSKKSDTDSDMKQYLIKQKLEPSKPQQNEEAVEISALGSKRKRSSIDSNYSHVNQLNLNNVGYEDIKKHLELFFPKQGGITIQSLVNSRKGVLAVRLQCKYDQEDHNILIMRIKKELLTSSVFHDAGYRIIRFLIVNENNQSADSITYEYEIGEGSLVKTTFKRSYFSLNFNKSSLEILFFASFIAVIVLVIILVLGIVIGAVNSFIQNFVVYALPALLILCLLIMLRHMNTTE